MPAQSTVYLWLESKPDFSEQYATSRDCGLDAMAEETLEIADDGTNDWMKRQNKDGSTVDVVDSEHINRSRLRVDTRKWYLSKLAPKRYGERLQHEHSGPNGVPLPGPSEVLDVVKAIGLALRIAAERIASDSAKVIEATPEKR